MPNKNQRACAYCKEKRPLTREHIFPASIIEAHTITNRQNRFWLSRIQKEIPSDPVIKDVCGVCNSGFLSDLDSHGIKFFKETCLAEINYDLDYHTINFDYHLLKRWLMKIGFNSARANDNFGINAYEHMLPYIFGKDLKLGRSVSLFCAVNYPQKIPKSDQNEWFGIYDPTFVWKPVVNRISNMHISFLGVGEKWLKVVTLRGVTLFYTFFDPRLNTTQNEQRDFEQVFLSEMPFVRRLRPASSSEQVPSKGFGAWDAFRTSRSRIVFEG